MLNRVDHEIKRVWGGILDSIGVDGEVCFVAGLLGQLRIADVDSDSAALSAALIIIVRSEMGVAHWYNDYHHDDCECQDI